MNMKKWVRTHQNTLLHFWQKKNQGKDKQGKVKLTKRLIHSESILAVLQRIFHPKLFRLRS